MRCSPEQVVITTGAQGAFDLLARLLVDSGDAVWMEEPGYYGAQAAFALAGATLLPLHVTLDGWILEITPQPTPKVIYVTPSCHHPLGVTMQIEQRLRLLKSAERMNAWIIEDDYDSEFRFHGHAVPAMHGADNSHRVIYVGTFAKMLFPALRLAFMVLPRALTDRIGHALSVSGHVAPLVLQAALADFISEGLHDQPSASHAAALYGAARGRFAKRAMRNWRITSTWELAPAFRRSASFCANLDDKAVAAAARRRGIIVSPLSMQYRHGAARHGLVLGFASTPVERIRAGVSKLKDAFLEVEATAGVARTTKRRRSPIGVKRSFQEAQ